MRRWPQRRWSRVAVVTGLVVVLLVIADRATARIAGSRVAGELASGFKCFTGATVSPSVSISGFPFLAELADGRFRSVTVTADDVTLGGSRPITLTSIAVTAQDVTRPRSGTPAQIGAFSAEATVPYSVLPAELDGRRLRYGATSDGRLTISTTARVSVVPVPVTVIASVTLRGSTMTVHPEDIRVLGVRTSIDDLSSGLGRWLSRGAASGASDQMGSGAQRELPALPAGMTYSSATVGATGLTIRMAGRDLNANALPAKECVA